MTVKELNSKLKDSNDTELQAMFDALLTLKAIEPTAQLYNQLDLEPIYNSIVSEMTQRRK